MNELSNSDAVCILGFFLLLGTAVGFFFGYARGYWEARHEHK